MASRYFLNIGTSWSNTANWSDTSGGAGGFSVPVDIDDVFFDANSGDCDVNTGAIGGRCKAIDFTGYSNTISVSTSPIRAHGNVTLGAGMTIIGGNALFLNASGSIQPNGVSWPGPIVVSSGSQVITLLDNWTVGGLQVGFTPTINGFFLNVTGSFTSVANCVLSGSTVINLTGTGTFGWVSNVIGQGFRNTVNINTSGTITLGTWVLIATGGVLNYVAGAVDPASSTLSLNSSISLNTNGMTWNNANIAGGSITLNSKFTASGVITVGDLGTVNFLGSAGFEVDSFFCSTTAVRTINFTAGNTYRINNSITVNGVTNKRSFVSTSPGANVVLTAGGIQDVKNCNATWIDSSGGETIFTTAAMLDNTTNWVVRNMSNFYMFFNIDN